MKDREVMDKIRRNVATIFFERDEMHKKVAKDVEEKVAIIFKEAKLPFTLRYIQAFAEGIDCFQVMSGQVIDLPKKDFDVKAFIGDNKEKLSVYMFRMWLDYKIDMETKKIEEIANNAIK